MEKDHLENYKIEARSLQKYINQQFAEYHIPSIREFLHFKKHHQSLITALTFSANPSTSLPEEINSALEKEAILFLHSGIVELHKKEGQHWRRDIELKEPVFFTLLNYKNMYSPQAEWFKIIFKSKCYISILPINSTYNFVWMKSIWLKNNLLSKVFFYSDEAIEGERKKNKFYQFIQQFQLQTFRRDTRVISEGKKNDKIYIIFKGEAKIYKQLRHENANGQVHRSVQIVYLREGSVIGGELFLLSSKPVYTIISNHYGKSKQLDRNSSKASPIEEQENEEQQQQKSKKKQKDNAIYNKMQIEDGGYELYDPHDNISNFTVVADSANLETLSIPIEKLISILNLRCKGNFLKLLQQSYITILRRTHEKMVLELDKEKIRIKNNQHRRESVTAQLYSSADKKSQVYSEDLASVTMQRSEMSRIGNLSKFQIAGLVKHGSNKIQKRTELLMSKQQPKKTNFKEKIETLLEAKLNDMKTEVTKSQIADDLAEIFMKKNDGRTEDIEKHNELLQKKTMLLEKRGGWKPGWNQLMNKEVVVDFVERRRKSGQMPNYLTGLNLQNYTDKLKYDYAVKIHQTNKIKEQSMKIKSECPCCTCYQHFEKFKITRRSMTSLGRTGYKTAQRWGKASKVGFEEESLETVYNKMSFLSEKTKEKYNHNIHILKVHRNRDRLEHRKSAPLI